MIFLNNNYPMITINYLSKDSLTNLFYFKKMSLLIIE
jgi:hypothetical protein